MPGGFEPDRHAVDRLRLAIGDRLRGAGVIGAVARRHDRQCLGRGKDGIMARPCVIGMAVRDQGPRNRARRVDVEIADRGIKTGGAGAEQLFWAHRFDIMAAPAGRKRR